MIHIQKTRLDSKIATYSCLFLILFIVPVNLIHELGHGLVCALDGNQFSIGISVMGGSLVCFGTLENPYLFYVAGGLLAGLVSFLPFVKKKWVMNKKWPAIVSLSLGISNLINAFFETILHDWYIHGTLQPAFVIGMLSFAVFAFLIFKIGEAK